MDQQGRFLFPGQLIRDQEVEYSYYEKYEYNLSEFHTGQNNAYKKENFTSRYTCWIRFCEINSRSLKELGSMLKLHPLTVEEIQQQTILPKSGVFSDHLFVSVPIHSAELTEEPFGEHINLILFKNCLITFENKRCIHFDEIVKRIEQGFME